MAAHTDPVTRVALCFVDNVVWCHFRPTRQDGIAALVQAAGGGKLDYFQELLLIHLEPTPEEWELVIESAVRNKQYTVLTWLQQEKLLDYTILIFYSDDPAVMTICKNPNVGGLFKLHALYKAAAAGNLNWFLELQALTQMTRGMYEKIAVKACETGQLVILLQLADTVYDRWEPLQTACCHGHLNCVQHLIRDTDDITECVKMAITHRQKDVARWLLDNYTIDWERIEFYVWAILLNLMWTNLDDVCWLHNLRWKDTYIMPSDLTRHSTDILTLNKCGTDVMHWLHEKNIIQDSNILNFIRVAMLIGDLKLLQFLQATYNLHWDIFIMHGRHRLALSYGHDHITDWLLTHFTVQDIFDQYSYISSNQSAWLLHHCPTMLSPAHRHRALFYLQADRMWNEVLFALDIFPDLCDLCNNHIHPVRVHRLLLLKLLEEQEFGILEQVCVKYNILHHWETHNKLGKLILNRLYKTQNWPHTTRKNALAWLCRHIPPEKRAKEVVKCLIQDAIRDRDTRILQEFSSKEEVWPLVKYDAYLRLWCQQPDFFWDQ